MRRLVPFGQAAISLAAWPLIIIFSPVVIVAGEPVNRYVLRRVRSSAPARAIAPLQLPWHVALLFTAMCNPLWIMLTAPGRWVSDRFGRPPARASGTVSGC